jgi:hypothetical protein
LHETPLVRDRKNAKPPTNTNHVGNKDSRERNNRKTTQRRSVGVERLPRSPLCERQNDESKSQTKTHFQLLWKDAEPGARFALSLAVVFLLAVLAHDLWPPVAPLMCSQVLCTANPHLFGFPRRAPFRVLCACVCDAQSPAGKQLAPPRAFKTQFSSKRRPVAFFSPFAFFAPVVSVMRPEALRRVLSLVLGNGCCCVPLSPFRQVACVCAWVELCFSA